MTGSEHNDLDSEMGHFNTVDGVREHNRTNAEMTRATAWFPIWLPSDLLRISALVSGKAQFLIS